MQKFYAIYGFKCGGALDYDRAIISLPIACIILQRKIKVVGLIREAFESVITLSLGTYYILIRHRCSRHSWMSR
jgi:hypothetical protein